MIAILAGVQALVPAVVAVGSLYATVILFGNDFDPSSAAIVIVAVLCLVLVQPPREVSTQLDLGARLGRSRCDIPLAVAAGGAAGRRLRHQVPQ